MAFNPDVELVEDVPFVEVPLVSGPASGPSEPSVSVPFVAVPFMDVPVVPFWFEPSCLAWNPQFAARFGAASAV